MKQPYTLWEKSFYYDFLPTFFWSSLTEPHKKEFLVAMYRSGFSPEEAQDFIEEVSVDSFHWTQRNARAAQIVAANNPSMN